MPKEQSCGHTKLRNQAAGRTARFEQGQPDILRLSDLQDRCRSGKKLLGHIRTLPVDDPRPTVQDSLAVAADQIRSNARRGQAAKLLRADRNIPTMAQPGQTAAIRLAASVIAGAKADQAATDKAAFSVVFAHKRQTIVHHAEQAN